MGEDCANPFVYADLQKCDLKLVGLCIAAYLFDKVPPSNLSRARCCAD